MKQYRRHDRARIKARTNRSYKLSGKTAAWNRHKEVTQEKASLEDWYSTNVVKVRPQESKCNAQSAYGDEEPYAIHQPEAQPGGKRLFCTTADGAF